jgi:hypothetical protein
MNILSPFETLCMKKNFTYLSLLRSMFIVLLFTPFSQMLAQHAAPDYCFRKPVLEKGTDLEEGAVYRFGEVKPGVDALVRVKKFHGGVTLHSIDETWTGFDEAFQPFINCEPGTDGFVEFEIEFVYAGTTDLMNQREVPITPIDVDGGMKGDLFEQDEIKIENGYVDYELMGGKLNSRNMGAGWFRAKNITGIALDGIDTVDREAMFTVVNADVNSIKLKVGAQNTSDKTDTRYRSVYFQKFIYNNNFLLLSAGCLKSFTGLSKNNQVNLQWILACNHQYKTIVIEKSSAPGGFTAINETLLTDADTYSYTDNATGAVNYYRLKMTTFNNKVEYSNVLVFKTETQGKSVFKVYPSIVQDNATVSVTAVSKVQTSFQLVDVNGRNVYQQPITLQAGTNNVSINGLNGLPKGSYIAIVKAGTVVNSQKIIKE